MTLSSFSQDEYQAAKKYLASRVAYMMGRKFEEGDWAHVYCRARNISLPDWSNLHADIVIPGLSLEHKMIRCSETQAIKEHCGTDMMHPALTRRVTLPDAGDAEEAMNLVIQGYQLVLNDRIKKVRAISKEKVAEIRTGWLLYESSLSEFLYFEEKTENLDPSKHRAVWKERIAHGEGGRRSNKNLWIYNRSTGRKVWSVTGVGAGTKIQPYFTVPAADDQNLCYFRVQGEPAPGENVRIWITEPTANNLIRILGGLEAGLISNAIHNAPKSESVQECETAEEPVHQIIIPKSAYISLVDKFRGVSDEHRFQLLYQKLSRSS